MSLDAAANPSRKLSIVMPVYNESGLIETVMGMVASAPLPEGWQREIIAVDDHSTDGTADRLSRLSSEMPSLRFIPCAVNGGKGAAVKIGFGHVTGDWVIIQDADLEYDPNDYVKLLEPVVSGQAEIVCGFRDYGNSPPGNRSLVYYIGREFMTRLYNVVFGSHFTDIHTCYKLFPAHLIPQLQRFRSNDFSFDAIDLTFTLMRSGLRIAEVPVTYRGRGHFEGKKLRIRHGLTCITEMVKLRCGFLP